jgi:hypothetical protein
MFLYHAEAVADGGEERRLTRQQLLNPHTESRNAPPMIWQKRRTTRYQQRPLYTHIYLLRPMIISMFTRVTAIDPIQIQVLIFVFPRHLPPMDRSMCLCNCGELVSSRWKQSPHNVSPLIVTAQRKIM